MEQHDPGSDKDPQTGHDGPEGFPRRGTDNEETPTRQPHTALCGLHDGGAYLHYNRAHEERKPPGVPAR